VAELVLDALVEEVLLDDDDEVVSVEVLLVDIFVSVRVFLEDGFISIVFDDELLDATTVAVSTIVIVLETVFTTVVITWDRRIVEGCVWLVALKGAVTFVVVVGRINRLVVLADIFVTFDSNTSLTTCWRTG
jgi:hypothetical protein